MRDRVPRQRKAFFFFVVFAYLSNILSPIKPSRAVTNTRPSAKAYAMPETSSDEITTEKEAIEAEGLESGNDN